MVVIRNADEPLTTAPYLVLDGPTFYATGAVRKEPFVPQVVQRALNQYSMDYHIVALFPPEDEESLTTRAIRKAKKLVGLDVSTSKYPIIGKHLILDYKDWLLAVREYGSPLFYIGGASNELVYQTIPARNRVEFPMDGRVMRHIMSQYVTGHGSVPPDAQAPPKMDVRKAWQNTQFAKGKRDRFSDKFK